MDNKLRKDLIRKRLIEEIEASKMPRANLAKELGCTGSLLSQYKYGNKLPSIVMLAKICEVIGADANYILGISE